MRKFLKHCIQAVKSFYTPKTLPPVDPNHPGYVGRIPTIGPSPKKSWYELLLRPNEQEVDNIEHDSKQRYLGEGWRYTHQSPESIRAKGCDLSPRGGTRNMDEHVKLGPGSHSDLQSWTKRDGGTRNVEALGPGVGYIYHTKKLPAERTFDKPLPLVAKCLVGEQEYEVLVAKAKNPNVPMIDPTSIDWVEQIDRTKQTATRTPYPFTPHSNVDMNDAVKVRPHQPGNDYPL